MSFPFHRRAEACDRLVPFSGDVIEVPAHLGEASFFDLPNPFAALTLAPHEPGLGERVEVLRDRLAGDLRAASQTDDRLRAMGAQTNHDGEARLVPQRSK